MPLSEYYVRNVGIPYTMCKSCYNQDKRQRDANRVRVLDDFVVCNVCKKSKPRSDFHKNRSTGTGLVSYCKACAYVRNIGIKYKVFNMEELLRACGNKCEICKKPFNSTPHIDHDHSCCTSDYTCGKCFRGLLCGNCNYGLGHFKDSPEALREAANYLEKHAEQ